jgi:hypothetical protein
MGNSAMGNSILAGWLRDARARAEHVSRFMDDLGVSP